MSTVFTEAFEKVIGVEGKYSNNPLDSGGETMFGITIARARESGYTGSMRAMPLDVAQRIYQAEYWDALNLNTVALISKDIAFEMFDTGVNCGTGTAARFLQIALNAFNRRGRDYPDIEEDGAIGPRTLGSLRLFLAMRKLEGETVLLRALNCLQGGYYIDLSRRRQKDEEFTFGWFRTRILIPGRA